MASPPPPPATSPASATRLPAVDVVRGVAVLGILVPNIIGLGQPFAAYTWPGGFLTPPGRWDSWLWGLQSVLADGRFRGLFTLLFGAGLILLRRAADRAGAAGGTAVLARRLGWLFAFGFAHWALLWRGDILMGYACAGLLVLACTGWPWQRLAVLAGLTGVAGAGVTWLDSVPLAVAMQSRFKSGSDEARMQADLAAAQQELVADGAAEAALMAGGDHLGLIRHSLGVHLPTLPGDLAFAMLETVPLVLAGMALCAWGLFAGRLPRRRQAAAGAALWLAGTAAGVPVALMVMAGGVSYWDSLAAFNGWAAVPRTLAALGLLLLLVAWGAAPPNRARSLLASAGRCAFSNYLGTTLLATVLFSGAGLGLFGRLDRLHLYALVPGFWLLMLAWPVWWLRRFRHGPLEWLWRCLTYGRIVPFRR